MSISWMPMKYQGALVGLGLRPGLALAARGALKSMEMTRMTASNTRATATSRTIRLGMVLTFSPRVPVSSSGNLGITRPFAFRMRQK